jgi:Tfp pilus assembly protein PilF
VSRNPDCLEGESIKVEVLMTVINRSACNALWRNFSIGALFFSLHFLFTAPALCADSDPTDTLPMFGQPKINRSEDLKKADDAFIRDSTLRYGNRQAGSNTLTAQGWAAVRAGQDDVAMRRFNQAWLLNPKNYSVFWGYGAVLSAKGKLSEALEYLETARQLVDDPKQRVALLCDLGAVHSAYAARMPADRQLERAQQFVLANNRFSESLENDPKFAQSWREWAFSLYDQERYSEAWLRVKKARELNAEPFPPEFVQKLSAKMPEPN